MLMDKITADIGSMSLGELAAFICEQLRHADIDVVLTGGSCVSLYSDNQYESFDLDFIETSGVQKKRIKAELEKLNFKEKDKYFIHPDSEFFVEFPSGPLAVGSEPVKDVFIISYPTGNLRLISPTDCVKDRLSAFYFWKDQQCLDQAVMVAKAEAVDLDEVERWSKVEGMGDKFLEFTAKLEKTTE
jgi:hypothetical protein